MKTKSHYPVDFTSYEIDLMTSLYLEEDLGCRKIAERLGCGKTQVLKELRKAGVTIRDRGEICGRQGSILERFSSFFNEGLPEECWEWQGGKNPQTYGLFTKATGDKVYAHRFSWELVNGNIPDNMIILHKCDNRCCVNPHHLSVGTVQDNMRDMVRKGRNKAPVLKGSSNGRAKLTETQIQNMRLRYEAKESPKKLITEFGISKSQFWRIINHERWA